MRREVGNNSGADCLILNEIEAKITPPTEKSQINRVEIQRTNASGSSILAASAYQRSGSTTCTLIDGSTMSVPYSAISTGYPPSQRCTVLPPSGCTTLTPARTTVDTVAVQITYVYPWHTPLRPLMDAFGGSLSGPGFTFDQRNVFRMEPTL